MKTLHILGIALFGILALQGCSNLKTPANRVQSEANKPEPTPAVATREFPAETLYALLVAEVAGNRNRFDIALGNYIQQAHRTRDPKVAARATHIGQYLKAHQATLDTAQLWLELEPSNNEARLIVATELSLSGRLLEAFEQSKILLERNSTTLFQDIAARAARATDTQREQLLQAYTALLAEHPKYPQLLVGRGLLQQQRGQLDTALKDAIAALKQKEDYIPAAILEAKLLNQLKRPDEALKNLSGILERHPDNKRLRLQYARLLSAYDLDRAYEQFTILAEQSPYDPDLRLSLALICTERGNSKEAKKHFDTLLLQQQRVPTAHYYLGRIAEQSQQTDQALQHYLKVDSGADFLPALLQASNIMLKREDFAANSGRFNEARKKFPKQSEHLFLLESEILREQKQLQRAEQSLTQGLRVLPLNTKLLYSRAMLLESQKKLPRAEADLRTIIKYEPDNATALNALGYTLADNTPVNSNSERLTEALAMIEKALNITPHDPAVIDSLGWVHYRLGNLEEAILRLRQAMKAYPDPEIAAHLGEVLWAAGDHSRANEIWFEGMQLDPENSIIANTVERLTGAPLKAPMKTADSDNE
jgi:tetratricopeptide (TPR) repeat protein